MGLVKEKKQTVIDTSAISRGSFIYIECELWEQPKRGIVAKADEDGIEVLYRTGIADAVDRLVITPQDLEKCALRWSEDLETISVWPEVLA